MNNKAAFCTGIEDMEIMDAPMPKCGHADVLIEVKYCGVCGSDAYWYAHGEVGFEDVYPYILGHEFAGTIIEVGERVKNFSVGDRVAVEPGVPCGKCKWCKEGRYNLCPDIRFLSAPRAHGAMQKYVAHPAEYCFKLPDNISCKSGALIEPFAVGLHAIETAQINPSKTIAILGAGCIGLCTLLAAKLYNASRIFVIDIFDNKLKMALDFGADAVINSKNQEVETNIKKLTNDRGVDIVLEAAGTPITTALAEKLVSRGGDIVLIGSTHNSVPFEFYSIISREVSIKPIFRYCNNYPVAIDALAQNKVELESLITSEFSLNEAKKAFDTALYDREKNIKVMVKICE